MDRMNELDWVDRPYCPLCDKRCSTDCMWLIRHTHLHSNWYKCAVADIAISNIMKTHDMSGDNVRMFAHGFHIPSDYEE